MLYVADPQNDEIQTRLACLREAVKTTSFHTDGKDVVEMANNYYDFVTGNSTSPAKNPKKKKGIKI